MTNSTRLTLWLSSVLIFALLAVLDCHGQDFNRDIRPLLSDRCFQCHGPDEQGNESGLRLDIASEAHGSSAFVPGDVAASLAIQRMESDDPDLQMPPVDSHLKISEDELALLREWVVGGAEYDQHWSFKPLPTEIELPAVSDPDWCRNEIDRFALDLMESRGFSPATESERWRWLRRVTYDLTGLPPTEAEIQDFLADSSDQAYERVVDRLLASERFGEHMAVSWLDAARYADSYGYQSDLLSPTWPYRDWVVRAFNDNLPYNQFLQWQIAGDLLPNATRDQKLATAFNRLHRQTNEGGSVELEWRTEYAADRVHTFGTAMLGMTLECARCHDHKFDPVTQRDYYNLFAFFNNIDEWGLYLDSARVPTPSLLLPTEQQEQELAELEDLLAESRALDRKLLKAGLASQELQDWLAATSDIELQVEPVAHWSLDERDDQRQFANLVEGGLPATSSMENQLVPGVRGQALEMTGDDSAEFRVEGNWLEAWQPYSVSFWLWIPKGLDQAVLFHRQGGTDVGNYGTKGSIENGRLRFQITRFWPGNALAIESELPLPQESWNHIVFTNDGRGTTSGMSIYVNGESRNTVLNNHLSKDPQFRPGGSGGFVFGQQFRRIGLKQGRVDEIQAFDRALSPIEVTAVGSQETVVSRSGFTRAQLTHHFLSSRETESLTSERVKALLQKRVAVMETMVMEELPDPRPAYVLHRGDYDSPRTEENLATRSTPAALPEMLPSMRRDRLGLAQWLTADSHPLAARVAINRIWQGFFGEGLVETPDDFGLQSRLPLHDRLLDWLARDFIDHQWDLKRLCRMIVLSATYRQSSRCDQSQRNQDPDNQWLARGPSRRLTAEMIRDTALYVSGLINPALGGPPVSPYQPINIWRENNTMTPAYRQSVGTDLYRRSLYTVWKRTTPMPNMVTFDAPGREVCTVMRSRTNSPQQAMVLLNDVQFVEAARVIAEKLLLDSNLEEIEPRIDSLFRRLTARLPDVREKQLLLEVYHDQVKRFTEEPENATSLIALGESPANDELEPTELAAMTVVVQAVLNSDATVWKR